MNNKIETWADFADNFDMVLFNDCVNQNIADGAVLMEWSEAHQCEPEGDRDEFNQLRADDADFAEQYQDTDEAFAEWSQEQHQCECEVYQWYAIDISETDVKLYNDKYNMDIFFSDTLGIYILPVYHFGTAWRMLKLSGDYATD